MYFSLLAFVFLTTFVASQWSDGRPCKTGCIPNHYGCHCEQVCKCKRWFDCDDGPTGTGKCICQYNRWNRCKLKNPLKQENMLLKRRDVCVFEIKTLKNLQWVDRKTSRAPRKVLAMISHVLPTTTSGSVSVILKNRRLSNFLYLTDARFEKFIPCLSGEDLCEGSRPYAHAYMGHQFGSFAGQLGDGRAITIGHTAHGSMEVSLKGAGRTMFSRFGDGLASLYSVCRELLGSVYLHSIGVPVVQSLAVFSKEGSFIYRDEWYRGFSDSIPAGLLVRVGESFLRIGSVQHAAKQVGFNAVVDVCKEALQVIARMEQQTSDRLLLAAEGVTDQNARKRCFFAGNVETRSCANHWKKLTDTGALRCLFEAIVQRSAALVAVWMSVGFAHGVMNTDNISLIGRTIDLNVFGFIARWDKSFTPNFIDTESRYAFGRQADIMYWNLQRLGDALSGTSFLGDNHRDNVTWMLESHMWLSKSQAEQILQSYYPEYEYCFYQRMKQRLGLKYSNFDENRQKKFVQELMNSLAEDGINYHYFSRQLADLDLNNVKTQRLRMLLESLRDGIIDKTLWRDHIYSVVPSYVFDNNEIAKVLKKDSFSPAILQDILEKFYDPFVHMANVPMYSAERVVQTSCGGQ